MYSFDSEKLNKRITLDLLQDKDSGKVFICPICQHLITGHTSDEEGHLFCYNCIMDYLQKSSTKICPINGEKHTIRNINMIDTISVLYKTMILKCPNKGCNWENIFSLLPDHLNNECPKEKIPCNNSNLGCKEFIVKENMQKHLDICEYRKINCPNNCENNNIIFCKLKDHLNECPNEEIFCPKKCGSKLLRKDVKEHMEKECQESEIPCKYKEVGCNKFIKRKLLDEHLINFFHDHNIMLFSSLNNYIIETKKIHKKLEEDHSKYQQECLETLKQIESYSIKNSKKAKETESLEDFNNKPLNFINEDNYLNNNNRNTILDLTQIKNGFLLKKRNSEDYSDNVVSKMKKEINNNIIKEEKVKIEKIKQNMLNNIYEELDKL